MSLRWGATIAIALGAAALLGCGTGSRRDLPGDGPGGGQLLPTIFQVDTGVITLEAAAGGTSSYPAGTFNGGGQDLVLTDSSSGASLRLIDQTTVRAAAQTYNPDGDEVLDFIVLVMRALSAQAAANVTAKKAGALVDPVSFIKVGGAAFLPYDAGFSTGVVITLPVHSSAAGSLELFRFIDATTSGRLTAEDIGDHTGEWEYVQDVSLEANSTVIFSANTFGQYCIATSETIHDSGEGGSTE